MRIAFRVDLEAFDRASGAFLGGVERGVWAGLDAAAELVAAQARAEHPYRNRSGDLEGGTRAQAAEGDVWDDAARAEVNFTESYAPFVDAWARSKTGRGIFEDAWAKVERPAASAFEGALRGAST